MELPALTSSDSAAGRVLVVGAGIGGLACAHELRRRHRQVLVLEASGRPGGVIDTLELEGFRFETGPNAIARSARAFCELCVELGIAELWLHSAPEAKERYLWHQGALVPLPRSPLAFARTPLLSRQAKLRILREPLRRARLPATGDEPSLAAFFEERLGAEATRRLVGAFVRGIYAGELEQLGAESAFPRLFALVRAHGGLLRGLLVTRLRALLSRRRLPLPGPEVPRGTLLSFRRGLCTLVEALHGSLGEALRLEAPVRGLRRRETGWSVILEGGEELSGEAVVLCVPAPVAARLLAGLAQAGDTVPPSVVATLDGVEHAALTLVHLGCADAELPGRPRGFGYLVPPAAAARSDGMRDAGAPGVLGTIFASDLFPQRAPAGCFAVTSIYRTSDLETRERDGIVRTACADLALACGAAHAPRPRVASVQEWREVIPQYSLGHARRIGAAERELARALPGLFLGGAYTGGVSVDDVIARGRALARLAATGRGHQVRMTEALR